MKRLFLVGLVTIIMSCMISMHAQAQMYWDLVGPEDETIGAQVPDVYGEGQRPVQIRESVQMYDNFELPELGPQPEPQVIPAPIPSRVQDAATPVSPAPRQQVAPLRSPERTPSTARTSPQPSVTSPGSVQEAPKGEPGQKAQGQTEVQKVDQNQPPSTDQPVTRKMKWGQGDTSTSEPKTKP